MFELLQWWPQLAAGAALTVALSTVAFALGTPLAMLLLVLRAEWPASWGRSVAVYVSFFRGTPFLIQLMVAYYVLPGVIGLGDIPAWFAGLTALALNTAAFSSEVFRGAYRSIPLGQHWASDSLGMNRVQKWRFVLSRQVVNRSLGPLCSELTTLVKASSLLSVISVNELTAVVRDINNTTSRPLEVFTAAALSYGIILIAIVVMGHHIEKKLSVSFVRSV